MKCDTCGAPSALRRLLFDGGLVEELCAACWLETMREIAGLNLSRAPVMEEARR